MTESWHRRSSRSQTILPECDLEERNGTAYERSGGTLSGGLHSPESSAGGRQPSIFSVPRRNIFPVAVRFYNVNARITDAPIDFREQANETSSGICEHLATRVDNVGFSLERAVACGAGGASVSCGGHSSVFWRTRKGQLNWVKANCNLACCAQCCQACGEVSKS